MEIYSPAQSRSIATEFRYWWDIDKKNNVILYRFIEGTNNKNVIDLANNRPRLASCLKSASRFVAEASDEISDLQKTYEQLPDILPFDQRRKIAKKLLPKATEVLEKLERDNENQI